MIFLLFVCLPSVCRNVPERLQLQTIELSLVIQLCNTEQKMLTLCCCFTACPPPTKLPCAVPKKLEHEVWTNALSKPYCKVNVVHNFPEEARLDPNGAVVTWKCIIKIIQRHFVCSMVTELCFFSSGFCLSLSCHSLTKIMQASLCENTSHSWQLGF